MLLSKTVILKWNSKIKKHYESLGYTYTKMKDEFEVNVSDLTSGSAAIVDVECDYCHIKYQKIWSHYLIENCNSHIHKDCCDKCKKYKCQESNMDKYGVKSVLSLSEIKNKIASTNLEKYGAENPFSNEEIKVKIRETNLEKYGCDFYTQTEEYKQRAIKTCTAKYGVPYFIMTQRFVGEDNPRWKGGVEYHRRERATYEYRHWRKNVFNRDKYMCQCCGDKSLKGHPVKLIAHHIYNWKDNIDKRYDVDNGITLCEDCHLMFHIIYGKRNNTPSQLKDFLFEYGKKVC